jgi:ribosome biogenesis GTPase
MTAEVAVVLARDGGAYRILYRGEERTAVLRGTARRDSARAVAGDRVTIDPATAEEETLAISGVEPRSSLLARRTPEGRGARPVAANVDQVMVVIASADPDPILQLIDRLLVVAEANEIPAIVVVNKVDLAPPDAIVSHLAAAGYPVLPTAANEGVGIAELGKQLAGKVTVMTGPSGAGKSSLLNAIEPGLGLRIGAISVKARRGRHTTTTAVMVPLAAGGFVVDTPGFSEVGVWDVTKYELAGLFPEMASRAEGCRFGDCRHRHEPGCAVLDAVAAGEVSASRHAGYLAILAELEGLPESWE